MQSTGQLPDLCGLNIILTTSFHVFLACQRSKFYQATSCSFVKQLLAKPRIYYWPNQTKSNQIKSHLCHFLLLVKDLIEKDNSVFTYKLELHSTVFQLFTHCIVIHLLLLILLMHSLSYICTQHPSVTAAIHWIQFRLISNLITSYN